MNVYNLGDTFIYEKLSYLNVKLVYIYELLKQTNKQIPKKTDLMRPELTVQGE